MGFYAICQSGLCVCVYGTGETMSSLPAPLWVEFILRSKEKWRKKLAFWLNHLFSCRLVCDAHIF